MAAIKFVLDANVLQFSKGIQYPVQKPEEKTQVLDTSAAGELQVEDLGVTILQFPIKFKSLPLADYTGLMNWHGQICNGAEHTFTYFDEEGQPYLAKCLTTKIDFPQTSYHRYSGELLLRVVG